MDSWRPVGANLDNADSLQLTLPFDEDIGSALDTVLDNVHDKVRFVGGDARGSVWP
ncbi:hypothetical protein [Kibdelosporangium philippinense]|uniref:hypothetical protein n=1 Tax=Kibdelosporangium philippinense TaxID=211113 RepID=UPI003612CCDE